MAIVYSLTNTPGLIEFLMKLDGVLHSIGEGGGDKRANIKIHRALHAFILHQYCHYSFNHSIAFHIYGKTIQ